MSGALAGIAGCRVAAAGWLLGAAAKGGRWTLRCGLDAEVAREQSGFKVFKGRLIDDAGERDEAFDFGGERLAGARDGLLHAVEEACLWLFFRFFFFVAAK